MEAYSYHLEISHVCDGTWNPAVRLGDSTYVEDDPAQMTGGTAHPFGYTGRRWDPDLGLYYYRARWYDPTLGTFLQTDPIGALDYINLYAYVGAEPGNGVDPTGMTCTKVGNSQQYTCRFDEVKNTNTIGMRNPTAQDVTRANRGYTVAVNRLMANPNRVVQVNIGQGRTGNFKASDVANSLISNRAVLQAGRYGSDNDVGATSYGRGITYSSGDRGGGTPQITVYSPGFIRSADSIMRTMVHEGMHFQPADRNVTGREGEGGRDHQGAFRQAVEELIR